MNFGLSCIILSTPERVIDLVNKFGFMFKIQTITTFKHPFQIILKRLNIASVKDTALPTEYHFLNIKGEPSW
ncbi:hypothetical protein Dfri01_31180 [Dyadobacter frigoris]|nr:hypothetical protein Dfri01_31180 [Dyadobacter frigoris]